MWRHGVHKALRFRRIVRPSQTNVRLNTRSVELVVEPVSLERVFYLASAPSATTGTIKSWPIQVT